MMNEKHMPKSYWAEAANTDVYLMNQCTTSRVHEVTPHKKNYRRKPDLSHTGISARWHTCTYPTRSGKS